MNKAVKQRLFSSILCIIIGTIFFVYPIIFKENIKEELYDYMKGFASGVIGVGLYFLATCLIALNSPSKGKKLENEIKDERLNKINACAMAITFRITLLVEALVSIICAFTNNMNISQYLGIAICFQLILYLIVYLIVKRKI